MQFQTRIIPAKKSKVNWRATISAEIAQPWQISNTIRGSQCQYSSC